MRAVEQVEHGEALRPEGVGIDEAVLPALAGPFARELAIACGVETRAVVVARSSLCQVGVGDDTR